MNDSILDLSVREFLDAVAARTPTPGGGGVTAITVAAAAALVTMAARFTEGHAADGFAERADQLRAEVTPLADADAAAYQAVLDAHRIPRNHRDRPARITTALQHATEIPLRIAEAGIELAAIADQLAATGNRNLTGDARTAAELAASAAKAAATLAHINIDTGQLGEPWQSQARRYLPRPAHNADQRGGEQPRPRP